MSDNNLAKFQKGIEKYYKRNFYSNVLDGGFYSLGMGFVSTTTILPIFVRNLTDSKFLISLVSAIIIFGGNIPQLISARWAEGWESKRKPLLLLALLMRLPWLVLAILTSLLTPHYTEYLLAVFFLVLTLHSFASGLTTPVWFDLLTKIIPVNRRGKFFGARSFTGSLMGIIAAFLTREIIRAYSFPDNFIILFALAFAGVMISYLCLTFVKEPVDPVVYRRKGLKEYLKKLPAIVSGQVNYRYFLLSVIFMQFFAMANGLFAVAALDKPGLAANLANEVAGTLTVILIISQTLTNLIWGHISDRFGHKLVIVLAACFNLAGVLIALFASSIFMFYLVFFLIGIAAGGNSVSFMTIVPEFCTREEKPTYIAITNTVAGLTSSFASIMGGFIADLSGYTLVFLLTSLIMFIGVVILVQKVREPRQEYLNLS